MERGEAEWSIGELAGAAGTTVRALHHYDERGLLRPARRTPAGHRRYGPEAPARLYRIVALRQLGLGLDDIAAVLDAEGTEDDARTLQRTARRHLAEVERRLTATTELRDRLRALVAGVDPGRADADPTDVDRPTTGPAGAPSVATTLEVTTLTLRLDRITTRTGDGGTTALAHGPRVAKDDPRIEAIGALDELNVRVGTVRAQPGLAAPVDAHLVRVQQSLFDLGAALAGPGGDATDRIDAETAWAEATQAAVQEGQAPLRSFVLPGGGAASVALHACRTGCRAAERRAVTLQRGAPEPAATEVAAVRYLNRLSDLFFVLAREASEGDVLWEPRAPG